MAARIEDVWPGGADLLGATFADRHYRARSVAEQCAPREGGDGRVELLPQRAQLHRNQCRDAVWRTAQIVVQPSHPRRPRDAVPSLDAHIAGRLGLRPDVRRVPIVGLAATPDGPESGCGMM